MDIYIIIILFVSFLAMEFMFVVELYSIINEKIILSGVYTLFGYGVYFLGVYQLIENIYYVIPAIIGATFGKMIAVYLKKNNKLKQ